MINTGRDMSSLMEALARAGIAIEPDFLVLVEREIHLHHESQYVALEEWMQRFVGYIATKRGMANSLRLLLATKSELFAKASGMVPQAMHRLVEAAAAGGYIRKDVESSDVLHALSGIYSAPDSPHWRERSRRLVRLLMDGLRWGASKKSRKAK